MIQLWKVEVCQFFSDILISRTTDVRNNEFDMYTKIITNIKLEI